MPKQITFLMVFLLTFVLVGCAGNDLQESDSGTEGSYQGKEVTINGLPCIIVKSKVGDGYNVTSIDCDWSVRHEGN